MPRRDRVSTFLDYRAHGDGAQAEILRQINPSARRVRREEERVWGIIPFADLEAFYDELGEYGWILDAYRHGFARISLIVTDSAPGGGPLPHTHTSEEAVVVPPGAHMRYIIGNEPLYVGGPAVVRIPAGTPHAFVNAGTEWVSLVCIFPDRGYWDGYVELGANPLLVQQPG